MEQSNKKMKEASDSDSLIEIVKRHDQVFSSEHDVMTVKKRDTVTKKEFFAKLSEAERDRIQAKAFRYLMGRIDQATRNGEGSDEVAHIRQLVADLYEDEWNWEGQDDNEKDEKDDEEDDDE